MRPIASNLPSTIRDLQRRKARGRRGLALIEGVRLVEEALAAGLPFQGALVAPDLARTARGVELVAELERHAVPVEEIGARTFAQLADTETPQGIIAVIEPRRWAAAEFAPRPGAVALVIDGVQDPGNVGTLIRTAHALGAAGTVVLRGTADPTSPKALRAAMGATFRHPVVSLDDAGFIAWARKHGVTLWAAAAVGGRRTGEVRRADRGDRRQRGRRHPAAAQRGVREACGDPPRPGRRVAERRGRGGHSPLRG